MVSIRHREKALVVLQLSGGNDPLNTVVPYTDGHYYDHRPKVNIAPEDVLQIDDEYGFHPSMGPIKELWDQGKVAMVHGLGHGISERSHFRSMDIWHTAEPDAIGTEGWLGRAIKHIDPKGENVILGVNFGKGLPRAMASVGVPVASVGNLETYGLFPDLEDEWLKKYAIEAFANMYGRHMVESGVMGYLGQTGTNALKGADILRATPEKYSSAVEYASNPIAQDFKRIAQVLLADVGSRIFYSQHGSFDTHSMQAATHAQLWDEVSGAVGDFFDDMREHGREDDVIVLMFSEFGRRVADNGSFGTDHGAGATAFVIGGAVDGAVYGEYPSRDEKDLFDGDLQYTNDFRSTYSTVLDHWLGLEPDPIVNGRFEQFDMFKN
ncbi:MAG: DUF1501 domain-containing protein [SAR202 cluster bacterium]|nr:DUF1501 domain-containing protein [SAR202 cluster bacterium]